MSSYLVHWTTVSNTRPQYEAADSEEKEEFRFVVGIVMLGDVKAVQRELGIPEEDLSFAEMRSITELARDYILGNDSFWEPIKAWIQQRGEV